MGWRDPLEQSEFEIQAEAFFLLKEKYANVRGEFHFKHEGRQAARFDIAILNPNHGVEVVVEVKRANRKVYHKQQARYQKLTGKPCVIIIGPEQAKEVVARVEKELAIRGLSPDIYK